MKRWGLVTLSTGVVENAVEQEDKPTEYEREFISRWMELKDGAGPGWKYNFETKKYEVITYDRSDFPTLLSRLIFIDQLGNSYINIVNTAKTDASVEVWLEKFRMKDMFNLQDKEVKDSLDFLVTKKLLSRTEADRILSL